MTEPLPCPFCGHVGVTHNEGSTFRWMTTECNGCGAQCGEERIDTLSKDQGTAIEQAKEAAIKTWNTRFTPFPPQRPWVGLEAEEILDLFDRNNVYGSKWIEFARSVETKLKERNT